MTALPSLLAISNGAAGLGSPLAEALSTLFESSPILIDRLAPQLAGILSTLPLLTSYSDLIDSALAVIEAWDIPAQSEFISGHPRIGETKNLSNLSAKEQSGGTVAPTPPAVLARLAHLNTCYETKYPGLRYITFVNGRSRQAVAEEMEDLLQIPHSLSTTDPAICDIIVIDASNEEWKAELRRAVFDVGRIAKSRLKALGVE